ncbi:hypothetical protein F4561_003229 [Lipingzhangella halophila]|uniref:Uncharacterized protein n=1 Tax=Lipingzhangella halophila TaxID=1783352 RepID=A0A7W7RI26_9ACTN|nr:hypothetical protein [Lipingzhangella halophila]MBB4932409.1 hypothetical protein [Lipingzhangella halophila]
MLSPEVLSILANVPLLLPAFAGLLLVALMARSSRVLTVIGLLLIIANAGWSLLRDLVLYAYIGNQIPAMTMNVLSWLSFLTLLAGFLLLALAATAKPKPAASPVPPGSSPHPPAPHHQPAPAAPHQGGTGPHPGA